LNGGKPKKKHGLGKKKLDKIPFFCVNNGARRCLNSKKAGKRQNGGYGFWILPSGGGMNPQGRGFCGRVMEEADE
jgi:hypothetical protein